MRGTMEGAGEPWNSVPSPGGSVCYASKAVSVFVFAIAKMGGPGDRRKNLGYSGPALMADRSCAFGSSDVQVSRRLSGPFAKAG